MPNTFKMFPICLNFTKSGHTTVKVQLKPGSH